jgi:hypothetical protein
MVASGSRTSRGLPAAWAAIACPGSASRNAVTSTFAVETSGLEPPTPCLQSRPRGIQGCLSKSQPDCGRTFGTGWTASDDGGRAINARWTATWLDGKSASWAVRSVGCNPERPSCQVRSWTFASGAPLTRSD